MRYNNFQIFKFLPILTIPTLFLHAFLFEIGIGLLPILDKIEMLILLSFYVSFAFAIMSFLRVTGEIIFSDTSTGDKNTFSFAKKIFMSETTGLILKLTFWFYLGFAIFGIIIIFVGCAKHFPYFNSNTYNYLHAIIGLLILGLMFTHIYRYEFAKNNRALFIFFIFILMIISAIAGIFYAKYLKKRSPDSMIFFSNEQSCSGAVTKNNQLKSDNHSNCPATLITKTNSGVIAFIANQKTASFVPWHQVRRITLLK